MSAWFVYILECADNTLYTGITVDVERRVAEHNSTGKQAAKYTRARQPVRLVYQENCGNRSQAAKREAMIKKMSRDEKLTLLENYSGV